MSAAAAIASNPWGVLVRRDHVVVIGMPGCGKTPFAAALAAEARRVVYFDPTGEWAPLGEVVTGEDVRAAADPQSELLAGTFMRVVVVPEDERLAEDFEATVAACRAAARFGGLVLLVDEVGDLNPACVETLQGLHRNGHKDGVATILVSPCASDIPKRCRDTASRVFSFFQKNHRDRQTLADEYGDDFARRAATWRHPLPPAEWTNPTLHA